MRPPFPLLRLGGFPGASVITVVAGSPPGLRSHGQGGDDHDGEDKDQRQGVFAFVGGIREGLTEERSFRRSDRGVCHLHGDETLLQSSGRMMHVRPG